MNVFSSVIILIFILFMGLGYARGLIKSVFKIVLTALALLLAYLLSPIISTVIIENTEMDDSVKDKIYSIIEVEVAEEIKKEVSENITEIEGDFAEDLAKEYLKIDPSRNNQIGFIKKMGLPEFLEKALIDNNHNEVKAEMGVTNFYDYVATYLARTVVNAIVFFLTFLILNILFSITLLLMNMVVKLPGLNGLNRLGGALLGFAEALLLVWVAFIVIDMTVKTQYGKVLMDQINGSEFLTFIREKNLLSGIVENIIKDI